MTEQARTPIWFDTILLAVVGAATQFGLLWLLGAILPSRVFPVAGVLSIAVLVLGGVLAFALRRRYPGRSCMVGIMWIVSYFIINFIGMLAFRFSGMPAWVYLVLWLGFGLATAWVATRPGGVSAALGAGGLAAALGGAAYASNRQERGAIKSSGFGRVPPATVILLSQHVRTAQQAAAALPPNLPQPIRDSAVEEVLRVALRDWWYNENLEGLEPADQQDLAVFVQLAWSACRGAASAEEAHASFRAALHVLLDDWCASWNGDDGPGAPRWQSA